MCGVSCEFRKHCRKTFGRNQNVAKFATKAPATSNDSSFMDNPTTKPRPNDGRYRGLVWLISEDGRVAPHGGCIPIV